MSPRPQIVIFAVALTILTGSTTAIAVTVEVAKKCGVLVAKAFPPRVPGNPAAGLARGTPQEQRDYFRQCLEKGGNMDNAKESVQGTQGGNK
jgi:hypothetical protein